MKDAFTPDSAFPAAAAYAGAASRPPRAGGDALQPGHPAADTADAFAAAAAEAAQYDVAIIGGGPAGSCAASRLAQAGLKVLVLEREFFPRFHIGESLLPAGNRVLKEIGVWDKVEQAGFVTKYGVEFEDAEGGVRIHNVFSKGLLPDCDYAYQVERSRFDEVLLDHAASCGAQVRQGHAVRSVQELPGEAGWLLGIEEVGKGTRGQAAYPVRSRWLLDASGRDCVLGKLLNLKADRGYFPSRVAVYAHFQNVERSQHTNGGNIIITRVGEGWSWHIPVSESTVSVGIVSPTKEFRASKLSADEYFYKKAATSPALAARMAKAEVVATDGVNCAHSNRKGAFHITADYSYTRAHFAGRRYMLIGDAACFSDPIFSSGVMMATAMGLKAADTLVAADRRSGDLTERDQRAYTRGVKRWLRIVEAMVNNFYAPWGFDLLLHPTDKWQMFAAINAMTAGNFDPPLGVRLRYEVFLILARLNRYIPITGKKDNPLRTWSS